MAKKCPPGVFCVENLTITFLVIIILLVGFFIYSNLRQKKITNESIDINISQQQPTPTGFFGWLPNYPYNNLYNSWFQKDVLNDSYAAPLRDERYAVGVFNVSPNVVPINVSTNVGAVDTNYRQMGIMRPLNGDAKDNILPLMGRPLFTNRDKWQYYTISNQHNNIKLPISYQGRSALSDTGVNQIYTGDTVFVEGYNEPFAITVYENDTIKYLPYV